MSNQFLETYECFSYRQATDKLQQLIGRGNIRIISHSITNITNDDYRLLVVYEKI